MGTVPGKNGGTLTPWAPGQSGNPNGRAAAVPLALRVLAKNTRNGELVAKRIVEIALGQCGEQFTGADQLRALTYVHDKLITLQSGTSAPVVDWERLTDDERSRLTAALALVEQIAERQAKDAAPPSP